MKKIKTLNEEMNRMKSLFGDDRLYGNLVELDTITLTGSKTLLSEQWGRLFSKIDDLKLPKGKFWSGTLKSFDELANFEKRFAKMLNTEIGGIDDLIKHWDEFSDLWKIALPEIKDLAAVKRNLEKVKTLMETKITSGPNKGKTKWEAFPEERLGEYKRADGTTSPGILAAFPDKGGIRQMIVNSLYSAKGQNLPVPVTKSTGEITVVKFTDDGKLMVGTKNSKNGTVTYKDPDTGKVTIIEPDPNFKGKNDLDGKKVDDGEYVDYEEIPSGSSTKDLNGKVVRGTPENYDEVMGAIKETAEQEGKKGNKVIFTIEGEGAEGIKAAEEMVGNITGSKGTSNVDDAVEEIIDTTGGGVKPDTPPKQKKKLKEQLKSFIGKLFTDYPTRFWLNPLKIKEGALKNLKRSSGTGGMEKLGDLAHYKGSVIFRTFILWPSTVFTYSTIKQSYEEDRSLITVAIENGAKAIKTIQDWFMELETKDEVLAGLISAVNIFTNGKVNGQNVILELNKSAEAWLMDPKNCETIINGSNEDILQKALNFGKTKQQNICVKIIADPASGIAADKMQAANEKVEAVLKLVIDNNMIGANSASLPWDDVIDGARANCGVVMQNAEMKSWTRESQQGDTTEVVNGPLTPQNK